MSRPKYRRPKRRRDTRPRRDKPTSKWLPITASYAGRCDLCGRQFAVGARIRYQPSTRRVRCHEQCQALPAPMIRSPRETPPKRGRVPTRPVFQGEYVSFYSSDDYVFRQCVICNRDFERAAGRVALAKKSGVCPACEESRESPGIGLATQAALEADRQLFSAYLS